MPDRLIRFCGADCGDCESYRRFLGGDESWLVNPETGYRCCWLPRDYPEGRDCPIRLCCEGREVRFCGACDQFQACKRMAAFYAKPGYGELRERMLQAVREERSSAPQKSPKANQRALTYESLSACSISRSVWKSLQRSRSSGRVLAVFEHACDLVFPSEEVLALVTPRIGNGPLNIVVNAESRGFRSVEPRMLARLDDDRLRAGDLEIGLKEAEIWDPRPDWESLRPRRAVIAAQLPALRAFCLEQPTEGSLLTLLDVNRLPGGVPAASRRGADILQEGWLGDQAQVEEGAILLAGLGNGLTPSGDDFLIGAMLWAWLAHPEPETFCHTLVEAAAPRTTTLSAAFLRAGARGECSEAWHALLTALSKGSEAELARAVYDVLAYGATSGADALAGFLWAEQAPKP